MTKFLLVGCLIWQSLGLGFVPPLGEVLKKAFSGRRSVATETIFQHQIRDESGSSATIEEKMADFDGNTYHLFIWNSGSVGATSQSSGYAFANKKKIFGSSRIFNSYFNWANPDRFKEVLISEGFSKRAQWEQYDSSYAPEGNPALWDVKSHYLIHPEVYFSRSEKGLNITSTGFDNGSSAKSVSFNKETFLLSEINWKEGSGSDFWWFKGENQLTKMGIFPSEMGFVSRGSEKVVSQLVQRRYLNQQEKKQWLKKFQSEAQAGDFSVVEPYLKILLSHR